MTSVPIRDSLADHLIAPQNAALVVDYQQNQFRSVRSMDSDLLLENVVSTAKLAKLFGLPIVHSTVRVAAGQDQSTLPVVDAIAGTSHEAHRAGLERVSQAGARPISWVSLAGELQRDWARVDTVPGIVEIVFTDRLSTA
jgi:nicotinamidase-related amidase